MDGLAPRRQQCAQALRFVLLAGVLWTAGPAVHAAPRTHTVIIDAMRFAPEVIEVRAGDTVVWRNRDPFPHTATAADGSFDSGEIGPQRAWKFRARSKGEFDYVCTLHPTMKARLVVR